MQTFLPFADFEASARSLDNARLGKQRLEVLQLLNVRFGGKHVIDLETLQPKFVAEQKSGWGNHPASKMWQAHPWALCQYGIAVCVVWLDRGYNDTILARLRFAAANQPFCAQTAGLWPSWLGDERFHHSHRANLVRKEPLFYAPQFPDVDLVAAPVVPYVWPIHHPTKENT